MPIKYINEELFSNSEETPIRAYAYACNCEGQMNTQVSVVFRNRYPVLYQEYRQMCEAEPPELNVGDCFAWQSREGVWIFSLAVHENMFCKVTSKRNVEQSFRNLREKLDAEEITSIAMPTIGGGIGALYWARARHALERAFRKWQGQINVYVKPVNNRSVNTLL